MSHIDLQPPPGGPQRLEGDDVETPLVLAGMWLSAAMVALGARAGRTGR